MHFSHDSILGNTLRNILGRFDIFQVAISHLARNLHQHRNQPEARFLQLSPLWELPCTYKSHKPDLEKFWFLKLLFFVRYCQ